VRYLRSKSLSLGSSSTTRIFRVQWVFNVFIDKNVTVVAAGRARISQGFTKSDRWLISCNKVFQIGDFADARPRFITISS
jgi:hypothetical protein